MANEINIAGKMRSATTEGILADAAEIQQKQGQTVEQAINELDNKATTADTNISNLNTNISNLNANTGISDYEEFSDQKEYKAGTTVLKDGLLYTFKVDHAAGAWDESQVEETSLKRDFDKKVTELEEDIKLETITDVSVTYHSKEIYIEKGIIYLYCIHSSAWKDNVIEFYNKENVLIGSIINNKDNAPRKIKVEVPEETNKAVLYYTQSKANGGQATCKYISYATTNILKNVSSINSLGQRVISNPFDNITYSGNGTNGSLKINNIFFPDETIHINAKWDGNNRYLNIKLKNIAGKVLTIIDNQATRLFDSDITIPNECLDYDFMEISVSGNVDFSVSIKKINLSKEDIIDNLQFIQDRKNSYTFKEANNITKDSDNLVNPVFCEHGYYIDIDNRNVKSSESSCSDYIKKEDGVTLYYAARYGVRCYNESKEYLKELSSLTSSGVISDDGIKYIRIVTHVLGGNLEKVKELQEKGVFFVSKSETCKETGIPLINEDYINIDKTIKNLLLINQPFFGKKFFSVGDSYTMNANSWYLKKGGYLYGIEATTGMTMVGNTAEAGNGSPLTYFAGRILSEEFKSKILEADVLTVLGGTNDYNHGSATLGSFDDDMDDLSIEQLESGELPKTIYGSVKAIIKAAYHIKNSIRIVFFTQPERGLYDGKPIDTVPPSANQNGLTMWNIAYAIKDCCSKMGVACFDTHSELWGFEQIGLYTPDNLHPHQWVSTKMGELFGSHINSLIDIRNSL